MIRLFLIKKLLKNVQRMRLQKKEENSEGSSNSKFFNR